MHKKKLLPAVSALDNISSARCLINKKRSISKSTDIFPYVLYVLFLRQLDARVGKLQLASMFLFCKECIPQEVKCGPEYLNIFLLKCSCVHLLFD